MHVIAELASASFNDDRRIAQLTLAVKTAVDTLDAARVALRKAEGENTAKSMHLGQRRDEIRNELLSSAPAEIATAISEIEQRIVKANECKRTHMVDASPQGARAKIVVLSNNKAIDSLRCRAQLRSSSCAALRLQPLDSQGTRSQNQKHTRRTSRRQITPSSNR